MLVQKLTDRFQHQLFSSKVSQYTILPEREIMTSTKRQNKLTPSKLLRMLIPMQPFRSIRAQRTIFTGTCRPGHTELRTGRPYHPMFEYIHKSGSIFLLNFHHTLNQIHQLALIPTPQLLQPASEFSFINSEHSHFIAIIGMLKTHSFDHEHPQRKHLVLFDILPFVVVASAQVEQLAGAQIRGGLCGQYQLQVGFAEMREVGIQQLDPGGQQHITGLNIPVVGVMALQIVQAVGQLIEQPTHLRSGKGPAVLQPPINIFFQIMRKILEIHAQGHRLGAQIGLLIDSVRPDGAEVAVVQPGALHDQRHHLLEFGFGRDADCADCGQPIVHHLQPDGTAVTLVGGVLAGGVLWDSLCGAHFEKFYKMVGMIIISCIMTNIQQQTSRFLLPGLRVRSFVTLPDCQPLDQQLSSLLTHALCLRQQLHQLATLPKQLQSLKQSACNDILNLSMMFEMVKNESEYQRGRLQAQVRELEAERDELRGRHMDKDALIADLTRKMQSLEKQQEVRDKTHFLDQLRTSKQGQEIATLNQRIMDLLNVIQASNNQINDLRTRLRHSNDKVHHCGHEEILVEYRDQVRAYETKNKLLEKELKDCKIDNCELAQALKEMRYELQKKSASKGKVVPRLDITLNDLEEQAKFVQKPIVNKMPAPKMKRVKDCLNNQPVISYAKQPCCDLFAKKPPQRQRTNTMPLQSVQNSNQPKIKFKKLIQRIGNQGQQRSVTEMQDVFERHQMMTISMTDRDFVQRLSLKNRPAKPALVESFLCQLRKSPNK